MNSPRLVDGTWAQVTTRFQDKESGKALIDSDDSDSDLMIYGEEFPRNL